MNYDRNKIYDTPVPGQSQNATECIVCSIRN